MMDKIRRILTVAFWLPVLVSLAVIVIYECELALPGQWSVDKVLEYYLAIAMEIVTICLIPLSLRLFKLNFVRKSIELDALRGMRLWGSLRIAMLTLPMVANIWLYYQFVNVAFGYMGIIGLLCLVFVYPSETRCNSLS